MSHPSLPGCLKDIMNSAQPKVNSTASSPNMLSPQPPHPARLLCISVAQAKSLESLLCPPHMGHPTSSPLGDHVDPTFKINPESNCFSPPSLGTAWPKPPPSHPDDCSHLWYIHVCLCLVGQSHMTTPSQEMRKTRKCSLGSERLHAHCTPQFLFPGKQRNMSNGGT